MEQTSPSWSIRAFRKADLPACRKLYSEGLLGGTIATNDTALDLDDIEAVYMNQPGNHFWVAQNERGEIVGMIGVQSHEPGAAEIRRLRVARSHLGRGIGSALLESAIRYCLDHQYLKITLDTYVERDAALRHFGKFRFRMDKARNVGGRDLMYFYLDLYTGVPRHHKEDKEN